MTERPLATHGFDAFPAYTDAEKWADAAIHVAGVPAALAAMAWLLATAGPRATPGELASLAIYGLGLIGMLGASAAYNLAPPGRLKQRLRRLDHAMIFVMIAGTYTPFALNALPPPEGVVLCGAAWFLAALGVALKLVLPRRWDRASLALYLGMGWMLLGVIRTAIDSLPGTVLLLIVLGGVVYSLGAVVHLLERVPFHNAVWHAMVLIGVGLHLGALGVQFGAA